MKHLSIGYLSQAANPNTAGLKAEIISNIIHDFQYRLLMASDGGVYLKSMKTRKLHNQPNLYVHILKSKAVSYFVLIVNMVK